MLLMQATTPSASWMARSGVTRGAPCAWSGPRQVMGAGCSTAVPTPAPARITNTVPHLAYDIPCACVVSEGFGNMWAARQQCLPAHVFVFKCASLRGETVGLFVLCGACLQQRDSERKREVRPNTNLWVHGCSQLRKDMKACQHIVFSPAALCLVQVVLPVPSTSTLPAASS